MKHIGIDGSKAGWFYVSLDDNDHWDMGILSNIKDTSAFLTESRLILVDIPISLRENGSSERLCDIEARRVLSKRKSSVFPAPCRQALNCTTYLDACSINEKITGRRLSQQTWAISSKIKQMDDFLAVTKAVGKIHEFHPEVAFWAMNNKLEMQNSKRTNDGFYERLALLSRFCPYTKDIVIKFLLEFKPADVSRDDLLDAIAGAVTAKYSRSLCTLPKVPEKDVRGLAMEIIYPNIQE